MQFDHGVNVAQFAHILENSAIEILSTLVKCLQPSKGSG